ncbi:hypothetical protein NC981_09260 [Leptolyngbya sp. DQ-M1]|uniref:hypothetical protein n=1 Tax=Leptolyngbya sp. DQ-M1 TaxID=2933920 RepID=UPI003296D0AD
MSYSRQRLINETKKAIADFLLYCKIYGLAPATVDMNTINRTLAKTSSTSVQEALEKLRLAENSDRTSFSDNKESEP